MNENKEQCGKVIQEIRATMNFMNAGNDSLDEIVFANRNRSYGAYAIRKAYGTNLLKSFTAVLLSAILLFFLSYVYGKLFRHQHTVTVEEIREVVLDNSLQEELEKLYEQAKPSGTAAASAAQPASADGPQNYQVSPDEHVATTANNLPVEPSEQAPHPAQQGATPGGTGKDKTGDGGDSGIVNAPPAATRIIEFADVMPSFPGGMEELSKYLQHNIRMPAGAYETGASGKVWVSFVVNRNGKISDVNIEKSAGFGFDEEAARVVEGMPQWVPGQQNGRNVAVKFRLPILFKTER